MHKIEISLFFKFTIHYMRFNMQRMKKVDQIVSYFLFTSIACRSRSKTIERF